MLVSTLIAGILFSTYGVFARAQSNARLGFVPPKSPARGSAKAGSAAFASANTAGGSVPMVEASYNNLSDGTYTGSRVYVYYGYVRVQVVVQNGQISNVKVLEHPNDNGTSRYINSIAMPYLVQEAVQAQSAQINLISGATLSSEGFVKSLNTALSKA